MTNILNDFLIFNGCYFLPSVTSLFFGVFLCFSIVLRSISSTKIRARTLKSSQISGSSFNCYFRKSYDTTSFNFFILFLSSHSYPIFMVLNNPFFYLLLFFILNDLSISSFNCIQTLLFMF